MIIKSQSFIFRFILLGKDYEDLNNLSNKKKREYNPAFYIEILLRNVVYMSFFQRRKSISGNGLS